MPKYVKGMRGGKRKGRKAFYYRLKRRGREVWFALGRDEAKARERIRAIKRNPEEALRAREEQGRSGSRTRQGSAGEMTVVDVASEWLKHDVATGCNEKGQALAAQRVRDFLAESELGKMGIAAVRPSDLQNYRVWLDGLTKTRPTRATKRRKAREWETIRRLSPQTIRHILADVRSLFRFAEAEGYIVRARFPRKRWMPQLDERVPDRLTPEEVRALVTMDDPWGFVARFGLATGLRWNELAAVQLSSVRDGVVPVKTSKSRKKREVPILDASVLEEVRGRVGRVVPPEYDKAGEVNRRRTYAVAVRQMRKLSGVRRFHPHQLRHTFASLFVEDDGAPAILQRLLGHSSVTVTEIYAKTDDAVVRREVARVRARRQDEGRMVGGTLAGTLPSEAQKSVERIS